jgi:hypothetical protein
MVSWIPSSAQCVDARVAGKQMKTASSKLTSAAQRHGGKALVPGRAKRCRNRWHNALDPNIDRANGRTGKGTVDKCSKLTRAVETHGGKDWAAIAKMIPGIMEIQCWKRWHNVLDPNIGKVSGCQGK